MTAFSGFFLLVFSLLLVVVLLFSGEAERGGLGLGFGVNVSEEVLTHKPMVEQYAAEYGISEYVNILLAIMQVESGGTAADVMQCSESLGLPPNTLDTEASIKQGCYYFSCLLASGEEMGCDLDSVIQAYNYGGGFLYYVEARGKTYTFDLAESFADERSNGRKVSYKNAISIPINGGWKYAYGNMFYVLLVKQYLVENAAGFLWPVPVQYTRISSYFGPRESPGAGASTYHQGIDIPVPTGTDIYASRAGTVMTAKWSDTMGNYIVIDHGDGIQTYYCHNERLLVKAGDQVSQGQVISKAGNTGVSFGSHLDFKVKVNGTFENPLKYVAVPQ